ncbi:MAG TPA: hypothetical protein VFM75_04590, partial [Modicisalibacter sp.]|nr:hypothetical protein [Modicisalibacter sp.]
MTEQRNDRQDNAAWQAARQWQERARQARPASSMSGPKMILTWLLFGTMMIVGTVLGLFFLLVGWLMLPLLRHRMKKRAEAFRAQQARDIGGDYHSREAHQAGSDNLHRQDVLEGD